MITRRQAQSLKVADADESVRVAGGTLYRKDNVLWVEWDLWGRETWTLPNQGQALANFRDMQDRWSE